MLDRLTSALSGSAPAVSRGYGYDAIGNRTTSTVDAASTTYAHPPTSHRLGSLSGATTRSYGYDAAGNPTQIDAAVHGYNLANRLTTISSASNASYAINALGQRVAKTVDGVTTRYVYDEQGRLIGEYDQAGNLIQETVWLDDLPVVTLRPAGGGNPTPIAIYYVHADHVGSPRAVTRPSDDAIVWRWDNVEPFGASAANENPSGQGNFRYDLRFPGQQYDAETGTNYNYFRDYDPEIGRYEQSDPVGLKGGLNTYAYVADNPLSLSDPTGRIPIGIPIAIIGGLLLEGCDKLDCLSWASRVQAGLAECKKECGNLADPATNPLEYLKCLNKYAPPNEQGDDKSGLLYCACAKIGGPGQCRDGLKACIQEVLGSTAVRLTRLVRAKTSLATWCYHRFSLVPT